jgi:hypothetical protein
LDIVNTFLGGWRRKRTSEIGDLGSRGEKERGGAATHDANGEPRISGKEHGCPCGEQDQRKLIATVQSAKTLDRAARGVHEAILASEVLCRGFDLSHFWYPEC